MPTGNEKKTKAGCRQPGLSGSVLKLIAMTSMVIDHTAMLFVRDRALYFIMRLLIGRIAFPLFCFLLVEGFQRTRNRAAYAGRLFCFALLSEIPFDLISQYNYTNYVPREHQNVIFTLLLGLLMLWGIELTGQWIENKVLLRWLSVAVLFAAVAVLAEKVICSSYGMKGIAAILLIYLFRWSKWEQLAACGVAFIWEPGALLALPPMGFYNGQRGLKPKLLFYAVYPVHMLLLYFLKHLL